MLTEIMFWLFLLLPFTTGCALLFLVLSRRKKSRQTEWQLMLGRGLAGALFIWSSMFVLVQELWYLSENYLLGLFSLLPLLGAGLVFLFVQYHRTRKAAAGLGRVMVGNALVLIALLSPLPLCLEVYFRFIYDETDSVICTKLSRRWLERYFHLNTAGFPDSVQYVQRKQPGRRRVTLVGDSFAAGYGVKRLEDRLVGRLRQSRPEWEVHLLARPGADTGQHLEFLTNYFRDGFDADEVVLIYYLNDVTDLPGNWNQALRMQTPKPGIAWRWLSENSYFANLIYHRLWICRHPDYKYENYCSYVLKGYQGKPWEIQKRRLQALRDLVQSHGARLSVVTFPSVHAIGPEYHFTSIHTQLSQFWLDMNVAHLDLLGTFDGYSGDQLIVNEFDVHPNELAHRVAAADIEDFLQNQISHHAASSVVPRGGP